MKTLVINTNGNASVKRLKQIAWKLRFKFHVLSGSKKVEAGRFAMMEEGKNEAAVPVSKTCELLRKAR